MKTNALALTAALAAVAALSPVFSPADEAQRIDPEILKLLQQPVGKAGIEFSPLPPAPAFPEGAKVTDELKGAIQLINDELIQPMSNYSNKYALMSRRAVRLKTEFHFAITDTSDSLFPFDVYQRHLRGGWEKIAHGVCYPGMESLKVAMPETGVMVDPIKHPFFAAALTALKRAREKRAG